MIRDKNRVLALFKSIFFPPIEKDEEQTEKYEATTGSTLDINVSL